MASLVWSGGDSPDFVLEKDSQGQWICPEYAEETLDQEKVSSTLSALCQVISSREIENTETSADYGLSPARRTVTITLLDGRSVTYYLGNLNTYSNRYYFQLDPDGPIYMVGFSVGQSMDYGIQDYLPASPTE